MSTASMFFSVFVVKSVILFLTVRLDASIIVYMINATHNETGAEKMTKTETKQTAQDILMKAMMAACYHLEDGDKTAEEKEVIFKAMDIQKNRIVKMFGYDKGSWQW